MSATARSSLERAHFAALIAPLYSEIHASVSFSSFYILYIILSCNLKQCRIATLLSPLTFRSAWYSTDDHNRSTRYSLAKELRTLTFLELSGGLGRRPAMVANEEKSRDETELLRTLVNAE